MTSAVNTNRYGSSMGTARRSRDDWTAVGLTHLGEVGVDKVRVDRIANELGVTKGSFYWHFKDRNELLGLIVDGWETRHTEEVIRSAEASGPDPRQRAARLWSITRADPSIRAELAIRDWARRDEQVASKVRRVDDRRLRYVESLLSELGVQSHEISARSLLLYSLVFSDYLITTTHPERIRRQMVNDAFELLLTAD